jgi:esterase/lipase superfamily enzyme
MPSCWIALRLWCSRRAPRSTRWTVDSWTDPSTLRRHHSHGGDPMATLTLYYGTNRAHEGADRWAPTGYGPRFSKDGSENLRFGKVAVSADDRTLRAHLTRKVKGMGMGDGEGLAEWLSGRPMRIDAYREKIDPTVADSHQPGAVFGSQALFADLKQHMDDGADVLIFIHGFNVAWNEAVGSALALQEMLNHQGDQPVVVVLFTWPSDGESMPFTSYRSDRTDAKASGYAVGRALLKFRDFLDGLRTQVAIGAAKPCNQEVHLLCHSMGNYVLQNALQRVAEFCPGTLPRILTHVFQCAADVDDDVLEPGEPLGRLDELAQAIHVYTNRGDNALRVSDFTKGNPDRLGSAGPARPQQVHTKVLQVDCTALVGGLVEHSYHLCGKVNRDIAQTIAGMEPITTKRTRQVVHERCVVMV